MIGEVTVEELPEVARVIRRTVLHSVDATELEKAAFLASIERNLAWCRTHSEAVHLKFSADAAIVGMVLVKDYWNLCHLFVDPAWQQRGIGKSLIAEAIARCRGKATRPAIRLNASRNAVSFYEALGFVRVLDAPAPYAGIQFEYVL